METPKRLGLNPSQPCQKILFKKQRCWNLNRGLSVHSVCAQLLSYSPPKMKETGIALKQFISEARCYWFSFTLTINVSRERGTAINTTCRRRRYSRKISKSPAEGTKNKARILVWSKTWSQHRWEDTAQMRNQAINILGLCFAHWINWQVSSKYKATQHRECKASIQELLGGFWGRLFKERW